MIAWHTYPLGLLGADQTGADRTCRRRLTEIVSWFPHLRRLGVDTLLLGPVFSSLSHGYDTVTHLHIDSRLGTLSDFDDLVTAATNHDIAVVLDGAFAYASREFWRLDEPAEADDPWFVRDDAQALTPWRVQSLVTPDYSSAGYRGYVVEVLRFWLNRGILGWRLDSAWSVPSGFWRQVLSEVRVEHPDAWFLAQVFDDDLPAVINGAGYSSATEYALMHGIRDGLATGDADRLHDALLLHRHNSTHRPVHTFVGNHDFARLADVVPAAALPLAFVLLLTLPGTPAIYYGDEFATSSSWTQGAPDAELRPELSPTIREATDAHDTDLLSQIERLGRLRRERPWLANAVLTKIEVINHGLRYTIRENRAEPSDDDAQLTVFINPTSHELDTGTVDRPFLTGTHQPTDDSTLTLPPHGWGIYG